MPAYHAAKCAVEGCEKVTREMQPLCPDHYKKVSKVVRSNLCSTYQSWLAGEITDSQYKILVQEIIK